MSDGRHDPSTHRAYSHAGVALAESWSQGKTLRTLYRKGSEWLDHGQQSPDWRMRTLFSSAANRMKTLIAEKEAAP